MSAKKATDAEFLTKELVVLNKSGIHARPAALFVKTASRFGSKVTIHVKGADADAALSELEALVKRKFDEE